MKLTGNDRNVSRYNKGMSLLEISLVIFLILGLAALFMGMAFPISDWRKAKNAGLDLQAVYTAQKTYLADHPTQAVSTITSAQLIPYLPNNMAAIPTPEGLGGATLTIDFTVIPPLLKNGASVYDPSGKSDDGLWDAGKL